MHWYTALVVHGAISSINITYYTLYIYIFHIYVLSIIVHRYFHKILRASLKHFPLLNSSHVSIFRCMFLYDGRVLLFLFFRFFFSDFSHSVSKNRNHTFVFIIFSILILFLSCWTSRGAWKLVPAFPVSRTDLCFSAPGEKTTRR